MRDRQVASNDPAHAYAYGPEKRGELTTLNQTSGLQSTGPEATNPLDERKLNTLQVDTLALVSFHRFH